MSGRREGAEHAAPGAAAAGEAEPGRTTAPTVAAAPTVGAAHSGDPAPGATPSPVLAVVVAAGSSTRMGGVDKLDADLEGRSVLRRSVESLVAAGVERIVIVTAPARISTIAAAPWLPDQVAAVVAGGFRRQDSVAVGIAALVEAGAGTSAAGPSATEGPSAADPVILVHDAARPLASVELIRAVARATAEHGAAIPAVPVVETLKRVAGSDIVATVDRSDLVAAQTPQGVRASLLARAYGAFPPDGPENWTDEASLLEACKIAVHVIRGEGTNLKLTVPADLELARTMLAHGLVSGADLPSAAPPDRLAAAGRATTTARRDLAGPTAGRVGLGLDGHPFGPGGPLVLGGVRIEGAPRLAGHSDGDAALHAIADALLGAAGLGDLGRLFPADARTPAGIDSRLLLASVAERVRVNGWRIASVDLTIVAARPRLAALLPEMGRAIAAVLGVDAGSINVKASTGNLGGSEGAGRSISASAVALLEPAERGAGEATE